MNLPTIALYSKRCARYILADQTIGPYSLLEVITSSALGVLLVLLDRSAIIVMGKSGLDDKTTFICVFLNIIMLSVIAIPYISKRLRALTHSTIHRFLDLPVEDKPVTYSDISEFLGSQALGSFLATVTIHTGSKALLEFGPVIAAIYVAVLFIFSVVLITFAFVRFIYPLRRKGWPYAIASVVAAIIVFGFYRFGFMVAG